MSYREDVREIKHLTKLIDQAEADADAWKWERAERLARMCKEKTQREVATDSGLSPSTVGLNAQLWRTFGDRGLGERGRYYDRLVELKPSAQYPRAQIKTEDQRARLAGELVSEAAVAEEAVKQAVAKHGLGTVMSAVNQAHAESPRGQKLHQGVRRLAKEREAEEAEAGVSDWAIVGQILDGPAASLRDFAERCLDKGFTDDEARSLGALLGKHVRATADMIDAATEGATELTEEDLELLQRG